MTTHPLDLPDLTTGLRLLRQPFPRDQVGLLPKPTRKDAAKANCQVCGGWHGQPSVHLDYVGHADVTARLLDADPAWTWEFQATDEHGLPLLDREGNLWIRLTICGVTRIGVGDGGSMKEKIGDALRNAAMRFGVALELWAKGDRKYLAESGEQDTPDGPTEEQGKTLELLRSLSEEERAAVREWAAQEDYPANTSLWTDEMCVALRHRAHQIGRR